MIEQCNQEKTGVIQALDDRLEAIYELHKVMQPRVLAGFPVSDDVRAILARIEACDQILEEANDSVR